MQPFAGIARSDQPQAFSQALFRWRVPIFVAVVLLHVLAFNGQWRVGRDSALYRGLGRSLTEGRGYVAEGQADGLALPGYPLLLAGMQQIFGDRPLNPWPQLLVMSAMAMLTLVVVYRLVSCHFSPWMAVATTAMLGVNWKFVQQANELMTDIPFLLAVCLALLGHGRLSDSTVIRRKWPAIAAVVGGLAAAALIRPTFAAVAAAWAAACLWSLHKKRDRRAALVGLGALVVLGLGLGAFLLQSRPDGKLHQQYEHSIRAKVEHLRAMLLERPDAEESSGPKRKSPARKMVEHHFPEAFFGTEMWHFSVPLTVLSLLYGVMLVRVNVLWGLLVLFSAAMFLFLGNVPRYFLMVMPLLILGWVWATDVVGGLLAHRPALRGLLMAASLGLVTLPNLAKSVAIVLEQHGLILEHKLHGATASRIVSFLPWVRAEFLAVYRGGKLRPIVGISQVIASHVPAGQAVLGPEPRITSYLSGRRVVLVGQRPQSDSTPPVRWAQRLPLRWVVLPGSIYGEQRGAMERDVATERFITKYVKNTPAQSEPWCWGSMWLAPLELVPTRPPPRPPRSPASRPPKRSATRQSSTNSTMPASRPATDGT